MNAVIPILPIDSTSRVSHAIRSLRWFKATFAEQARKLETLSGITLNIDEPKLARAFVAWVRTFDAHRVRLSGSSRRDFVFFSAGLMLRELLRLKPAAAGPVPSDADGELPLYFWPEGYLYTSYCLSVCLSVIEQDYDETIDFDASLFEIRTWHSFRENVREDTSLAIAFLDQFVGNEPNWLIPGFFDARPGRLLPAPLVSR